MDIVMINTTYKVGGAAAIARGLHEYINKNTRHNSIFLYGYGGDKRDDSLIKISNFMQIYYGAFTNRYLGRPANLFVYGSMEKMIKAADVVHLHNLHGYYVNYGMVLEMIAKYQKPVIWTFHDLWPITGRCAFPPEDCDKWTSGCFACEYKDRYPKTYTDRSPILWKEKKELFNTLSKNRTVLISPCRWLKNKIAFSFMNEYRSEVIPNGINNAPAALDPLQCRHNLNLPAERKIVLLAAADLMDKRKGVGDFLETMDRNRILFITVGRKIKSELKNLRQFGYINNKQTLNNIYKAADILVLPSIEDNFPTIVLEAFSNGLPVLGFDTGGIPEQLDGGCGVVVKKGDLAKLKETLLQLLNSKTEIKRMSENCMIKYNRKYTIEQCAKRYLKLYESVKTS
ncbi:MAG: glycosyltransferase [Bacillota bacterium]